MNTKQSGNEQPNVRFYQGNKAFCAETPLLLIGAEDSSTQTRIGEHFIITGLDKIPLVSGKREYSVPMIADQRVRVVACEELKALRAEEILAAQLLQARDDFEFAISQVDPDLHKQFFWSGYPFQFSEVDERHVLCRMEVWALHKEHDKELLELSSEARTALRAIRPKERSITVSEYRKPVRKPSP